MNIILYSGVYCPYSHRCRIVFCEKEMEVDIREVDLNNKPEELSDYNPYNRVPALVDRNVKLYESNIINEYLDDRFPHPQLVPTDIMLRAHVRLKMHEIDREIFDYLHPLIKGGRKSTVDAAKKKITDGLKKLSAKMPKNKGFIASEDFTMLDIALAPLLWRLQHFGIKLPRECAPLEKYAQRVFSRPSFINSLSVVERAMRK